MDWRESLREVWQQYRGWLLGGLAVMLIVGGMGAFLLKPNQSQSNEPMSSNTEKSTFSTFDKRTPALATAHSASGETTVSTGQAKAGGQGDPTIEVKGAVNHPGVYRFKANLRVINAINRAGGLRPDADSKKVNQAQILRDQMVIYIPAQGETMPTSDAATSGPTGTTDSGSATTNPGAAGEEDAPIGLNSATKEQLTKISGVGDKKAQKILDFRTAHNGFKSIDDLKQISGFGEKTVERLKPHLNLS